MSGGVGHGGSLDLVPGFDVVYGWVGCVQETQRLLSEPGTCGFGPGVGKFGGICDVVLGCSSFRVLLPEGLRNFTVIQQICGVLLKRIAEYRVSGVCL